MKKMTLLAGFCLLLSVMYGFNDNTQNECEYFESFTVEDVLNLNPEGYDQWVQKTGLFDGAYYESVIAFSDGTRGKLFKGGISGSFFIEDSNGNNYYYVNLRSALRALYIYKRAGCISSKYKL